jgi:hypothetical protein
MYVNTEDIAQSGRFVCKFVEEQNGKTFGGTASWESFDLPQRKEAVTVDAHGPGDLLGSRKAVEYRRSTRVVNAATILELTRAAWRDNEVASF